MFISETRLPHILRPEDYCSADAYRDELALALADAWHVVATTPELAKPGEFVVRQIGEASLQVRNFDGQLAAVSNVCAHRHALICSESSGCSTTMRCQYHGWEYRQDGSTGKIPEPKNFVPFDREQFRVPTYRVETLGQLVFVNLSATALPLQTYFGDVFYDLLNERFSDPWRLSLKWEPAMGVNWKIPVENSLEAYHVPAVHPGTFRADPGPDRTTHGLLEGRTWFKTTLPFSPHSRLDHLFQSLESRFVSLLGVEATGEYEQHHVFPNLLFSFTDAISLCNCVIPDGPQSSSSVVRQFGRMPKGRAVLRRGLAKIWSRLTAAITKRILQEDLEIYSAIQGGLQLSQAPGVLGRCEERIHRFQQFIRSPSTGTPRPMENKDD